MTSASVVKGKRALLRAAPRGEPLHAAPDNFQLLLVIVLHLHLHCFCFIKFFFLRSPSDPSNAKQYFQNPPMQWLPQELPRTPPPAASHPSAPTGDSSHRVPLLEPRFLDPTSPSCLVWPPFCSSTSSRGRGTSRRGRWRVRPLPQLL